MDSSSIEQKAHICENLIFETVRHGFTIVTKFFICECVHILWKPNVYILK